MQLGNPAFIPDEQPPCGEAGAGPEVVALWGPHARRRRPRVEAEVRCGITQPVINLLLACPTLR